VGHVTAVVKMINTRKIFAGKREEKGPLRRHRRRWEDNIKMDLREVRWKGVEWIDMACGVERWRAVVNTVMRTVLSGEFRRI
jgi:hypothetical protein